MPTLEQTTQEVLNLAVTHFKLAPGSLAPEDDFFQKLGIDSLQTLDDRINARLYCWIYPNIPTLARH